MNEALPPSEALDFLCAAARRKGADRFDAVAGESESLGLEIFEGKIKSTEISASRGIGIRLFRGKKPGFAFTERLSVEALARTLEDAWSHAALTDEVELDLPLPEILPDLDLGSYNPALENISLDRMKSLGFELEGLAVQADPRIENVPYLGVSRGSGMSMIRNSNGVAYQSQSNSVSAGLGVVAKSGEARKMGIYSRGGRNFDFDSAFMVHTATERAVELLDASTLPSGGYPVVFSNRVSPQIFSMFSSPFFAESVQKGQSRLAGKIGARIAWDGFDLCSDPHLAGAPGSHLFDGEGVVSRRVEVMKGGILLTYLHNLESAKKAGAQPTGNGARGYSGKAGTGFANYRVPPGKSSLQELLAAYPRCFHVVKLEGGSGCSAISGEISIGAQGFLVEGGKRVRPVDRVTLSGNFFDLLHRIRGLSGAYSDAFSSVKVPDVLVDEMRVSG